MKLTRLFIAASALSVMAAAPVQANAEKQDAKAIERQQSEDHMASLVRDRVFTDDERRIIEGYYRNRQDDGKKKSKSDKGKSKDMPPGLAKRDELPPGLKKQLEKNGTLPPGLEKRRLPDDLNRRLPRRLDGIGRYEVGQDVILLDGKSSKILDIMRGVNAAINL